MARRTLTLAQWFRQIAKAVRSLDESEVRDLGGETVNDVADRLGVTKQSVHKMIDTDKLDALVITSKKGSVHAIVITQASLDYYLAHRYPRGSTATFSLRLTEG